jgi:uncharacterized membrane protein YgcG
VSNERNVADNERSATDNERTRQTTSGTREKGKLLNELWPPQLRNYSFAVRLVMATMRAMVKQRLSIGLVLLTATFAAANCNSGDTVVSVNVSYDSTAMDVQMAVSSLQIVVKPKSGGGSPVMTTVPIMRDDAGAITTPVFKRITVNGWSGPADVTVDARGSGDSPLLSATTTVQVDEHEAVAAFVRFARVMPDAGAPDASADAADAGGSGGTTGGSGGTDGSGGASGAGGTVSGSGGA